MDQYNSEIYEKIKKKADEYSSNLVARVQERVEEMKADDTSHYLIYKVLGVPEKEGELVDVYQNKGRFLYKYAGSFLEEAAILCFQEKYPMAKKVKIPNTIGKSPKEFEIDCLVDDIAHEIKWRDATTDGDHISKEHTRLKVISDRGFKPIRIMFYYPNREQAKKIQEKLEMLYHEVNGEYYYGDNAFDYVKRFSGTDLFAVLNKINEDREREK